MIPKSGGRFLHSLTSGSDKIMVKKKGTGDG